MPTTYDYSIAHTEIDILARRAAAYDLRTGGPTDEPRLDSDDWRNLHERCPGLREHLAAEFRRGRTCETERLDSVFAESYREACDRQSGRR